MKKIEYKTWPALFGAMVKGKKKFDLRLADRDCREGDILVLKEYDPKSRQYTGKVLEKKVTYVVRFKLEDFWTKEDIDKYGIQVMSLK